MHYTLRMTDYWLTVWRRTWRGTVISSFLIPLLFLVAMGVGLGGFVDDNAGPGRLGGLDYLTFIAPGLLAVTAMQTGVFESTYPVMSGFKWDKFFYSMAATPLRVSDIVAGQFGFIAFRAGLTCGVFVVIAAAFGGILSLPGALGAFLVSVLVALAYAAPVCGISARLKTPSGFSLIFRLGLIPMFLFSGAFFPIDQLPAVAEWLARVTPIWHGVELCRMLTTGDLTALAWLHLAYLLAWLGAGWWYSLTGFERRLSQ